MALQLNQYYKTRGMTIKLCLDILYRSATDSPLSVNIKKMQLIGRERLIVINHCSLFVDAKMIWYHLFFNNEKHLKLEL